MRRKTSYSNVLVLCLLGACFSSVANSADVAFPRADAIGKSVGELRDWLNVPTNAIFPDSVQLDLKNGKVVGVICEYSGKAISYSSAKDEIQRIINVAPRLSDGRTTAWRIEASKTAIMLTIDEQTKLMKIIVRGFVGDEFRDTAPSSR
jgi:hypothetical protein